MGSPDRKKRKHKKKHSSSSRSKSYSSENSYDRHYSHRKRRKSKGKKHSGSRERERSRSKQQKYSSSRNYGSSQPEDAQRNTQSPNSFDWRGGADLVTGQGLFPMPGMPGMNPLLGTLPGMGGMQSFPTIFNQRIPLQIPQASNYKPNKTLRPIKNPKTQFKGRVYIPYTFDIAMVTLQDPYLQKEVPKNILSNLCNKVIGQMEKRVREQKQDEQVSRKISTLQEEINNHIKILPIKKKKGENIDGKQKLNQVQSLIALAQNESIEQYQEDQLDQEVLELILKMGLKSNKENEIEKELEPNNLIKEAKDLYKSIKC